jgi:hypothetical protein
MSPRTAYRAATNGDKQMHRKNTHTLKTALASTLLVLGGIGVQDANAVDSITVGYFPAGP